MAATNAGKADQPHSPGNVRFISANRLEIPVKPMCHRVFSVALGLCVAVGLAAASAAPLAVPVALGEPLVGPAAEIGGTVPGSPDLCSEISMNIEGTPAPQKDWSPARDMRT